MATVDRSKLAIGYVRLSKIDQERELYVPALGIDAQKATINAYCQQRGFKLLGLYEERDVSGWLPIEERLRGGELAKQLAHADARNINLVVARFDRLFRNAGDALTTVETWRKVPIHLHLCDFPIPDLSSPTGVMMLGILAVFADFERRMIAERTRGALDALRRQGKRFSRFPPYGFRLKKGGQRGELEADLRERATLGRVYELLAAGAGSNTIKHVLEEEGLQQRNGKPWHSGSIRKLMTRLRTDPKAQDMAVAGLRWWQASRSNAPPTVDAEELRAGLGPPPDLPT